MEVFDLDWVRLVLDGMGAAAGVFLLVLLSFPIALGIAVIAMPVVWLFEAGLKSYLLTALGAWVLALLGIALFVVGSSCAA